MILAEAMMSLRVPGAGARNLDLDQCVRAAHDEKIKLPLVSARWSLFVPQDLLSVCVSAGRRGADFPTVWETVLKRHRLVRGAPVQASPGRLEIPLFNGQSLVYLTNSKEFSLY